MIKFDGTNSMLKVMEYQRRLDCCRRSSIAMISPGKALDVATGKGRNALFLTTRGFQVTAIDISAVGLEEGRKRARENSLSITWHQADLENLSLAPADYDLIVNINYLQRSLIPGLKSALKSGGHVIFETYLIDQQAVGHPKNSDYLLNHNELLDHFRDFRVLLYREGKFADSAEASFRAGIFAQKIGCGDKLDEFRT